MLARCPNTFLNIVGRTLLIAAGTDLIISRKTINCDSTSSLVVTKAGRFKSGENDHFDAFVKDLNQTHYGSKPYVILTL